MAFTDNLQALMSAKGISRRKLAKECGISPSAVNSWFNRSAENISLQTLKKLSDYFGISIEELVHGKQQRREITFSSGAYTDAELDQIKQFAHFLIRQRERND
jgi:transcriptional regulator with XRE-family HTH domain